MVGLGKSGNQVGLGWLGTRSARTSSIQHMSYQRPNFWGARSKAPTRRYPYMGMEVLAVVRQVFVVLVVRHGDEGAHVGDAHRDQALLERVV